MPKILDRRVAFSTPWFDIIAKTLDDRQDPHYTLKPHDYVNVLATTKSGDVLLVRQFRPVVEEYTLELPGGLIDHEETPEQCVRRELVEETGHEAGAVELLGTLVPDVGRLGNRMWCFAAADVTPITSAAPPERGLELVICTKKEFLGHLTENRCIDALHFAAVMLAVLKGRFDLSPASSGAGANPDPRVPNPA